MSFTTYGSSQSPHQADDSSVSPPPGDGVSCLSFSPKAVPGDYLAVGSWDSQLRCYEVACAPHQPSHVNSSLKVSLPHDQPVLCTGWHSEGRHLFSGSCDKTARMWDLSTQQQTLVARHQEPIKHVFWATAIGSLITGSWDRTVKYWDVRTPNQNPQATLSLTERIYGMDVQDYLMVVGTADRKIHVVDLRKPTEIFKQIPSPLKYQIRCVSCFPDQKGYLIGSIEGRVAVQHVREEDTSKNFTFKCHRVNQGTTSDIYAVNAISFHPVQGTFATAGGDGSFSFWDKDVKQRLKAFPKHAQAISCGAFNKDGSIFAYSTSYDWSKGADYAKPGSLNNIYLHAVQDECKAKAKR